MLRDGKFHSSSCGFTRLQQCRRELTETDGRIAAMKEEFARSTQDAEHLKAGLAATASMITRASMLAERLSEEKERWAAQLEAQETQQELCVPQCVLAAAYLTCLCAEDEDRRRSFLSQVYRVGHSELSRKASRLVRTLGPARVVRRVFTRLVA